MIVVTTHWVRRMSWVIAGLSGLMLLGLAGCTSDPPKPSPTVTPEQVRGHADKAFDKLKQEEQQRGTDSVVVR